MIKGIIFDFDGTLYDYEKCNNSALEELFLKISDEYKIDLDNIKKCYNNINSNIKQSNNYSNKFNKIIYIKQLIEELKMPERQDIPLHKINEYIKLYDTIFNSNIIIYDGIEDLFKLLKEQKIKIGILTNNKFDQQYNKLIQTNLIQYIDIIQSSDECGYEKPNLNIFLNIQYKMKIPFENLCIVGDNFNHDIEPTIKLGSIPFYFSQSNKNEIINNIFYFSDYNWLINFFNSYFKSVNELILLSKYFGQSDLNVQGSGGNISIKIDNLMLIKSSGCIMGNITNDTDYCIIDTNKCKELVNLKRDNILETKIFGYKVPSMESYFHSFMKKYTVHIHFILSNIFGCSKDFKNIFDDFKYPYCIIEYEVPGILLSYYIKQKYSSNCDIYFLQNHGLIISSNNICEIFNYYEYIFSYFNNKLNNKYCFESFNISKKYIENKIYKIVKETTYTKQLFENMIVCFPDLAVFVQNICTIDNLDNLKNSDIVIYKNKVYIVTENIYKAYSLIEIINSYIELEENSKKLVEIRNINFLQNMEQEKYRK
jgi:FMN phosphatase YigB (HAD superfamily)